MDPLRATETSVRGQCLAAVMTTDAAGLCERPTLREAAIQTWRETAEDVPGVALRATGLGAAGGQSCRFIRDEVSTEVSLARGLADSLSLRFRQMRAWTLVYGCSSDSRGEPVLRSDR